MEREEVCAEVHFAQKLASNEKKIRDRALKRLHKYLSVRSNQTTGFSYDDLLKIWKGLHYCMWMQDKPIIQEELSQRMARLLHSFPSLNGTVDFLKVFLVTLAREWNGIDSFRLDKFMMLCRDMVHESLAMLSQASWPMEECCTLARSLVESVMQPSASHLSDGLRLHLASVFMEELQKMPLTEMSSTKLVVLLAPFINFILYSDKLETVSRIMSSTVLEAWKKLSKNYKSNKRQQSSAREKKFQNPKDDEQMEVVDKEAKDNEDRMEVDEEEDCPKGPQKFDLQEMFLVMFRLAEKKKVHTSNRKLIYGLIKEQPGLNQAIQSCSTNSDSLNSLLGLVLSVNNSKSLSLLQSDGKASSPGQEATEENRKKKRKRKNRKQGEEKNSQLVVDESGDAPVTMRNEKAQEDEKKEIVKGDGETKENVCGGGHGDSSTKLNKKRKRLSSEGEDGRCVVAKKVKLATGVSREAEETPVKTGIKKKIKRKLEQQALSSVTEDQSVERNKNSNARNGPCSPGTNIPASPMELVMYPSSVKTGQVRKVEVKTLPEDSVVDPNEESVTFSPTADGFSHDASPRGKKKKTLQQSPGASETEPEQQGDTAGAGSASGGKSILGELCTAITSPGDLMKKAIAMVTPSGQGEVDQDKNTPGSAVTPGSKKKVVFNLRKNKANKFKDYLKSLATQPSSPYVPTKSPSQSILKSPAVSPPLSDADNSSESDTEGSPKRRKSRTQVKGQGSSGSKKRNSNGKKKKKNASPSPRPNRKSASPSPSNIRHKQRSRLKS